MTLNPEQQKLIEQMVESGLYKSTDEAIDAAISLLDERNNKLKALRTDVQVGLDQLDLGNPGWNGYPTPFSAAYYPFLSNWVSQKLPERPESMNFAQAPLGQKPLSGRTWSCSGRSGSCSGPSRSFSGRSWSFWETLSQTRGRR